VQSLLGRDAEARRLDQIVAAARQGRSAVLAVRGEAGVGKTALLDYAQAEAADLQVIRIDCVESEMELSFAAVHQLLRPFLATLGILPAPQRAALRLAFGVAEGQAPDRFLVGLAALGLLAGQASRKPLLCLVDDAHCLDQESADVLAFVARRLDADSIAIVFAVREPAPEPDRLDGLPELRLAGLAEEDARALLAAAAGTRLSRPVADQVIAETGGNPLALIEIGRELADGGLDGDPFLSGPLPLGRRLEQRYLREVRELPAATQSLLLAAAADPTGDPGLLARVGAKLGFTLEAAAAAESRQLITIHTTVRFRHPLIRSAVYYGASFAQRQQVEACLAAAVGPDQPDQRAWHLAHAVTGPDEKVAAELERAGERACRRGGWSEAAALFHRSATLTTGQAARARRMLAAAEASCSAGAIGRAQAELDAAASYHDDPRHTGLARRTAGRIHHAQRQPAAATRDLLAAAVMLGAVDVRLARDTLIEAAVEAQINGQFAPDGATRADVARAAQALPLTPGMTATAGDLLLDADTQLQLRGLDAARPALYGAIDAVRRDSRDAPQLLHWLALACEDATILGDEARMHELSSRMESAARQHGTTLTLVLALCHAGAWDLLAGDLAQARRCFTEMTDLSEARDEPWSLGSLILAAWRGPPHEAYALLDQVAAEAARQGQGYQLPFAGYARCVLELGQGRYNAAYASFPSGIADTSQLKFALPDLAEAAQRSGHHDTTGSIASQLGKLAAASPSPVMLGFLARVRALAAGDSPDADDLYREAVDQHGRAPGPAHLARSHLLYGEWLRRARRPRDARVTLLQAYQLLNDIGADGFAERARAELAAAGETRPAPAAARHGGDLTPQEAHVARLAAAGATNAEIAAQLYLSSNTVDYHLRKVFRKLGVTSRRQLARAQPDLGP
jgi:DNA-binding CsgD family transcriptional regulator